MKQRRYIGLIVSLLLIGAIFLVFIDPRGSMRNESRRIILHEADRIDRIILSDSLESTELERIDKDWFIEGSEPVNPVAVENLLYAAQKLQIGSIQTEAPELSRKMARKVRYYEGKKLVLQYDVGSVGSRFMIRPDQSKQIFTVSLPGYAGVDLNRVFSSFANHYREHLLIDILPSEIRYIEVERKGEEAFRFSMDELGGIACTIPATDRAIPAEDLDDLAIRLLFSYFTSIRYEDRAVVSMQALEAGVNRERWLARLYVESRQGESHTLNIFSMPGMMGNEPHMFQAIVRHNDDPEPLVINYIYLDVLMRGLDRYRAPV